MNLNIKYQKIYLKDFLPYDVRINLEEKFRLYLFNTAIKKAGISARDLGDKLRYTKDNINHWRRGATRPRFHDLLRILTYLNLEVEQIWDKIINFGSKGSDAYFKLPSYLVFDESLAWFFGYRDGDGSRINPIIGAVSSPQDVNLLLLYKNIFDNLIQTSNKWSVYLYSLEPQITDEIKKMFAGEKIISYQYEKYNGFINIQIGASRVNALFTNIENNLESFLKNSPEEVQSNYVKGFFDADGHVDIHGDVVLRQSVKGLKRIKRVEMVLDNLNIRYKRRTISSEISLVIYSQVDFKEKIGFNSKVKQRQLLKLIECYHSKSNLKDIESKICLFCKNPTTKKEIMFEFKINYWKISRILNDMVDGGKLEIVRRRPFTVDSVNSKINYREYAKT